MRKPRVKTGWLDARYESAFGGQQKTEPMQVRKAPPRYECEE